MMATPNAQPPNSGQSDRDRIIRQLPLVAGISGGLLLLANRLTSPGLTEAQARSDVVGVILSALLILTGLLWQRVQPIPPEAVVLEGEDGFELDPNLPPTLQTELAWASHLLLTNTVTRSLVIYHQGRVLLRRGILGPTQEVNPGPILERVLATGKPIYLVNLKIYPGRVEFTYLPPNSQGVICQPLGTEGAIILAAHAPRSYTKQDEAWIDGIADKLAYDLEHWTANSPPPATP
jgi:hypothetical protein